jgi:hypothetical protein
MKFITWEVPAGAPDERDSQCQVCGEFFPSGARAYFLVEEKAPAEFYSWGLCCPACHGSKERALRFVRSQVEALAANLEIQRYFLREIESMLWPENKTLN